MSEQGTIIKNFILDTNILIDDPDAIFNMGEHNVIIPDVVIEELDRIKNERSARGYSAKIVIRHLGELGNQGSFADGIPLGEGKGLLSTRFSGFVNAATSATFPFDLSCNDNKILCMTQALNKATNEPHILVTKDTNLRVKANSLQIPVEDYKNDDVLYTQNISRLYTGRTKIYLPSSLLAAFKHSGFLDERILYKQGTNAYGDRFNEEIFCNEFFEIYSCENSKGSRLLGRYDGKGIVPLRYEKERMHGITPRNVGQVFMQECLLTPAEQAPLVIVKAEAGCGKTVLALAGGLESYADPRGSYKKQNDNGYHRILICRPNTTLDENIGALPGTEMEKIEPYMRPIKDNLLTILKGDRLMNPYELKQAEEEVNQMFLDDYIKPEALAFQRGRSLKYYWFIADEMQNSTRNQAKTVATRGGKGTKTIVLGDPDQIDNDHLTKTTNGLVCLSEEMKGSPLCWQVTLTYEEGERSALAQEVAMRMS